MSIAGVKKVKRIGKKDLREKVGSKACIVGTLVKSRTKWAGHLIRLKDVSEVYRKDLRQRNKKAAENEEDDR